MLHHDAATFQHRTAGKAVIRSQHRCAVTHLAEARGAALERLIQLRVLSLIYIPRAIEIIIGSIIGVLIIQVKIRANNNGGRSHAPLNLHFLVTHGGILHAVNGKALLPGLNHITLMQWGGYIHSVDTIQRRDSIPLHGLVKIAKEYKKSIFIIAVFFPPVISIIHTMRGGVLPYIVGSYTLITTGKHAGPCAARVAHHIHDQILSAAFVQDSQLAIITGTQ